MAVKKTTTKASATKTAVPKKAAAPKAAAPKKAAPKKTAAPKKKATAKPLTENQTTILKKVAEAKTEGYAAPKAEGRVIESLTTKKLIKRGAKNKTTGSYNYLVTKTGEKRLPTAEAAKS